MTSTSYPDYITPKVARWIDRSTLMSTFGRVNIYTCEGIDSHQTMMVDLDVGTTPFMIRCPQCQAMATSCMYRVMPRQTMTMKPTLGWHRPDSLTGLPTDTADHVRNGGLLKRPLTDDEQELLS